MQHIEHTMSGQLFRIDPGDHRHQVAGASLIVNTNKSCAQAPFSQPWHVRQRLQRGGSMTVGTSGIMSR